MDPPLLGSDAQRAELTEKQDLRGLARESKLGEEPESSADLEIHGFEVDGGLLVRQLAGAVNTLHGQ